MYDYLRSTPKCVSVIVIISFFLLGNCVRVSVTETISDNIVRYMATTYNCGMALGFDEIKNIADSQNYTYDDDVLTYYLYFSGRADLQEVKKHSLNSEKSWDLRITDYIKNVVDRFEDNSSLLTIVDQYDPEVPVNSQSQPPQELLLKWNPDVDLSSNSDVDFLTDRVFKLILNDYYSHGIFRQWFDSFYPNTLLEEKDIKVYSEFLVRIALSYACSHESFERLHSTSSSLFPKVIYPDHIPAELLLAIAYKESRFFPGSYRTEISDGNIYAVSMGLMHILVDADFLDISETNDDIGDGKADLRTFALISYYYLNNSLKEETYFSDADLLTVRGSFLYCSIFLDMVYQRLSSYF